MEEKKITFDRSVVLGKGGFSFVYKGEFDDHPVAVKRVLLNISNGNEEQFMLELDHPNIVKLFHCESDDDFRYYAMELCDASLDQLFLKSDDSKKYNGRMPPYIEIFRQLATGLAYIHSKKLTHRDIKPNNVLITQRPGQDEDAIIKWADFGLSKKVTDRGTFTLTRIQGTRNWYAPEIQKEFFGKEKAEGDEEAEKKRGTVKSDVFVLGLVVGYLFLEGEHLYGDYELEIAQNIIENKLIRIQKIQPKLRECNAYGILIQMLEHDHIERITSAQIVEQLNSRETVNIPESNIRRDHLKITFDRSAVLGNGRNGSVFKGMFGNRQVAVKRVLTEHVNEIVEEAVLKLDHPNIVKLLHCEKDKDFTYYVLELCVASLDKVFLATDDPKKYEGRVPRQIEVFRQLAKGLAYIHSKQLIHRDITPSNILIVQNPGNRDEIIIKWCDFGLAKSINEKGYHTWTGVEGTRKWYAPEVLKKLINEKKAENKEFWGTVKSNVFVLGLVFGYIFLKGEHLFGSSEKEIHDNIIGKDPVNMKKINGEVRKYYEDGLLRKMLEHDQGKRMNSAEIVEQLDSIDNKLTEKEKEFCQICAADSSSDLLGRMNDFIRLGIYVNAKDNAGRNALHNLCKSNSSPNLIDAIQLLIPLGIDVNAKDKWGQNALHYLCKRNSIPNLIGAIQLLIPLGIDVNAKDNNGENALHFLCKSNSSPNLIGAIQLLIQLGIDVNAKNDRGQNALHHLCFFNSSPNLIAAIQLLHNKGIDAKDDDGWNALHYLCRWNSIPNLIGAIQLLIQLGIDVNAKENLGKNALHYLCERDSTPNLIGAIKLLIKLGIDNNAKDDNGRNALHYLCKSNSSPNLIDAIQLLHNKGIDVNVKDDVGKNALYYLCGFNRSPNLFVAIQSLIQLGTDIRTGIISQYHHAQSYLLENYKVGNRDEILKLLDKEKKRLMTARF